MLSLDDLLKNKVRIILNKKDKNYDLVNIFGTKDDISINQTIFKNISEFSLENYFSSKDYKTEDLTNLISCVIKNYAEATNQHSKEQLNIIFSYFYNSLNNKYVVHSKENIKIIVYKNRHGDISAYLLWGPHIFYLNYPKHERKVFVRTTQEAMFKRVNIDEVYLKDIKYINSEELFKSIEYYIIYNHGSSKKENAPEPSFPKNPSEIENKQEQDLENLLKKEAPLNQEEIKKLIDTLRNQKPISTTTFDSTPHISSNWNYDVDYDAYPYDIDQEITEEIEKPETIQVTPSTTRINKVAQIVKASVSKGIVTGTINFTTEKIIESLFQEELTTTQRALLEVLLPLVTIATADVLEIPHVDKLKNILALTVEAQTSSITEDLIENLISKYLSDIDLETLRPETPSIEAPKEDLIEFDFLSIKEKELA